MKTNQILFIPADIRSVRLSGLPRSRELAAALRKLRVSTFADLTRVSLRDFLRVGSHSAALFEEIRRLIQRAREGVVAAPPGQSPTSALGANVPSRRRASEVIYIPQTAREIPLAEFPASARLRRIYEFKGFRVVGDLQGWALSEVSGYRGCGKVTLNELRNLVHTIQRAYCTPADNDCGALALLGESPAGAIAFDIPAHLRNLELADVPMTVRLEGVLGQMGVRCLGDLHGMPVEDVLSVPNCGKATLSELIRLIEQAAADELDTSPVAWDPVALVQMLDTLVADLPPRNKEILRRRLGGKSEEPPTLEEIGAQFRRTRERVRQIVDASVERMRRTGSRRLRSYLDHIEQFCCEGVRPLTPTLLKQWLGQPSATGRFRLAFYVRLLADLRPAIPAWPTGQASFSQHRRNEEIERGLETVLRPEGPAVPFAEALRRLRTTAPLDNVTVNEFLATLQHSPRFKIEFPQPDAPVVHLARRFGYLPRPLPAEPGQALPAAAAQ